jgi:tetratricopeptide (TPR) repeat protein
MPELHSGHRVDEGRYFGELNFHPSHLRDELRGWLGDEAGFPLVVQGEAGSGRQYCIEAACCGHDLHGLPWKMVSIDWQLRGCQTLKELVQRLADQPEIRNNKIDWLGLVARSVDLEKGPSPSATVPLTIVLQVANTLDLARKLLAACSIPNRPVPGREAFTALRRLLKTVLVERNLILHIRNADILDMGMTKELLNLRRFLDAEAMAEQRQGRLLLAFSCSPAIRATELLGRRKDRILIAETESPTQQELRRLMDRNFSPNSFDDDLITALHKYGRADEQDQHGFPARIAAAVAELLDEGVLIPEDGEWRVNPESSPERISTIIGPPLYREYQERLDTIDPALQPQAERFMELAALCRQWIPQLLLAEYMGLDEEQGDELLDCLEEAFVETEAPLLIDEQYRSPGFSQIAVYRFAVPLLAVSLLPRSNRSREAEELLAFLEERLPKNDHAAAALCWQLAQQARPGVQERWREKLAWHFAPELAERFADMLLKKMRAGLLAPRHLLERAVKEFDWQSIHFLQAVISACERWYQEQGGVPANWDGALFLSLFGILLDDLGHYEEALGKHEAALEIEQRVLPADHPNIATSFNNIGFTLGELGRYEEALKKQEAALEILQRVLPPDHPNIATSFNNIGFTLDDLGRHKEALEKHKAALGIRQQVLPPEHPNIAISLNNIGGTLGKLGRYDEALKKKEAALDIIQRVLPSDHPNIASSFASIGRTLNNLGRHEEALKELETASGIQERVLPKDHPRRARTLRGIGNAYSGLEKYEEALENYQAALGIFQRSLPAEHPYIAQTLELIQTCREKLAENQNAEQ